MNYICEWCRGEITPCNIDQHGLRKCAPAPESRVEQDPTSDEALVAELRSWKVEFSDQTIHPRCCLDAATRIEALNRENAELIAAAVRCEGYNGASALRDAQEAIEKVRNLCNLAMAKEFTDQGVPIVPARELLALLPPVTADEPKHRQLPGCGCSKCVAQESERA